MDEMQEIELKASIPSLTSLGFDSQVPRPITGMEIPLLRVIVCCLLLIFKLYFF